MLIEIARDEIRKELTAEAPDRIASREIPESLYTKSGAFVSLYVNNSLRGCLGTFSEDEPLILNIKRLAISAALNDRRFTPISADEIHLVHIEISVLSPRKRISGPEDIEIGKHGIYIESGINTGTLLPQVAVKQGWNAEEFLGNCSKYKVGIGWDGWRTASLFSYEAIVFRSEDVSGKC